MSNAIKFENWDFLASHFNIVKEEKTNLDSAKEVSTGEMKLQIYSLSRKFPMFNENSIKEVNLDGVVDLHYNP